MTANRERLVAFAMDFASYLEENTKHIRSIVLFGSVARGKFDKESDIDIFIDTAKPPAVERQIKGILKRFKKTERFEKWVLKGVKAGLKPIAGDLKSKKWESLRASLNSDGMVLYGKYHSSPKDIKQHLIFTYGRIRGMKKRVNLHRKLFGYTVSGKRYPGIAEETNGIKLGHGVLMVPVEESPKVRNVFEGLKVPFRIFEVWRD